VKLAGKRLLGFRGSTKREAAAAAGVINYEDNSDCWPIGDDDDL
jgi:hypothetical protein